MNNEELQKLKDSLKSETCSECSGKGGWIVDEGSPGDGFLQPPDGPTGQTCYVCKGKGRIVIANPDDIAALFAIAEKSLAAPTAQTNQKPYGWLTGESTSHRQGTMQDLTTNYEWAKEICDKNNAENRFIDPEWVDEVPAPLYAAAQAQDDRVDEMAMLIRRLVRSLHSATAGSPLCKQALDYLKRKGLEGNPLRSSTTVDAAIGEKGNG